MNWQNGTKRLSKVAVMVIIKPRPIEEKLSEHLFHLGLISVYSRKMGKIMPGNYINHRFTFTDLLRAEV